MASMILVYVVTFGLLGFTLVAALRWPLVRGKHILCAALAVELGGRVVTDSTIDSITINDPGLSLTPPAIGPAISLAGWLLLATSLALLGGALARRADPKVAT